jgi:hypothetical protein
LTKLDGAPKPEENETNVVDAQTWYYCKKCCSGYQWNKTHKAGEHRQGIGKTKGKQMRTRELQTSSFDTGFGADLDYHSG